MFYFFQRGSDFVRCEINEADGRFVIVITEPSGATRTEYLSDSAAAHGRFLEIQAGFQSAGWWGPLGRD
jgi:hypothetical protein